VSTTPTSTTPTVTGQPVALAVTVTVTVTDLTCGFYSAPQCSQYYGNSVRLSVRPSVRLPVCHTPVLCQNDGT